MKTIEFEIEETVLAGTEVFDMLYFALRKELEFQSKEFEKFKAKHSLESCVDVGSICVLQLLNQLKTQDLEAYESSQLLYNERKANNLI